MLKSMTGFGRSKHEVNSREYVVEIRSVNNRYHDINIKMTRTISYLEEKVAAKATVSHLTSPKPPLTAKTINAATPK